MKFGLRELEAVQVSAAVTRQRTGGERLEFILYTYQPGATFPVHQHEAEQLTLVVEGQLVVDFEDEDVTLGAGEAIIIPGNRPHGAHVPVAAGVTKTYNVFSPVRDEPPTA